MSEGPLRNPAKSTDSPQHISEQAGVANVSQETEPVTGRASGPVSSGALTGFPPPPLAPTVRDLCSPWPCYVGGCDCSADMVLAVPGSTGEWVVRLCRTHGADVMIELAHKVGVGHRVPS